PTLPKISNTQIRSTLLELGNYEYKEEQSAENKALPYFEPFLLLADGAIYMGQWKYGFRHGRGICVWTDGVQYEGYWQDDRPDGQGRKIFQDGSYYIGSWVNGSEHGPGMYSGKD